MKKIMMSCLLILLLASCAMPSFRQKLFDASAVSMTKSGLKENERLVETGQVSSKFCLNAIEQKGSVGIFDETIKKAQESSQVDFILNASFFNEGNCYIVEGTGAKIQ